MIRFRRGRTEIECSTEAEAAAMYRVIAAEDDKRRRENPLEAAISSVIGLDKPKPDPWTADLFWKFIQSLGKLQERALGQLVRQHMATDEQLRQFLNLETNKQLAGVLSGISKQAAAHDIAARSVFKIERESNRGTVTKTYLAALEFLQIANQMNWPDE